MSAAELMKMLRDDYPYDLLGRACDLLGLLTFGLREGIDKDHAAREAESLSEEIGKFLDGRQKKLRAQPEGK